MLVLSRREGESVRVGGGIVVTVSRICGNKVRIGISAEKEAILRAELRETAGEETESDSCRKHEKKVA
ncbi:MAG: carbon storage regulator [Thermoguttaceae bacterium]|nr:carbon storage regulator [Thermoguttaceae bacterium]